MTRLTFGEVSQGTAGAAAAAAGAVRGCSPGRHGAEPVNARGRRSR